MPWCQSRSRPGSPAKLVILALPAQGLRTDLSAGPPTESLLQRCLSWRCPTLATLAGQPHLAGQRGGEGAAASSRSGIDAGFRWAQLLNKHKSWICRRLALLERLGIEAQAELRLGLLSPGLARQLTRLPVGNQVAVLAATRRASLTVLEVQGVVDLLHGASQEQEAYVLSNPRAALRQAEGVPIRDPRLSPAGNRLARSVWRSTCSADDQPERRLTLCRRNVKTI